MNIESNNLEREEFIITIQKLLETKLGKIIKIFRLFLKKNIGISFFDLKGIVYFYDSGVLYLNNNILNNKYHYYLYFL